MADWSALFEKYLEEKFGHDVDGEKFVQRFSWVLEFHEKAEEVLNTEYLGSMPAQDVYKELKSLTIPQCPIRVTNLGRANSAEKVVDSLLKLLNTQGGFEEKYRAAKFPQAGLVTITEILCVARPHRFICRNTAFTRALAGVVPFYTKKALDELPYPEFFDICSELVRILLKYLAGKVHWAEKVRYLLLYSILTEK